MSTTFEDELDQIALHEYTEKAYLEYSMYVINDRALPFIGDGLKPVQRRIVYAMQQLGITYQAKYTKSARAVGDVIGKFHPHGEAACYESMVLMAQPFSYRYPLVDGQGNWGAPDEPKSFAAQRYTEARLTREAALLYDELGQGTVDWVPNFDGTLSEPAVLPAKIPFLLLNGSSGIAVGMATDCLPHNLGEIAKACVAVLRNPKLSIDELLEIVSGPDLPTGGLMVSSREELAAAYKTGRGVIRCRAKYERENGEIVVTEIPFQSSPSRILEQIAQQISAKRLPMLVDLRDESDHENPTRLVLVPRSSRVDVDRLMSHLFATTDLERSYRLNFNVIALDMRPRVMSLVELIREWLTFRRVTVRRRMSYRIEQINRRLEIIDGLLVAYLNIDEIIRIVREEDDPKAKLMSRFLLSDLQATAILDLRVRQLSRLEQGKLESEKQELTAEGEELEKILGSTRRMNTLIQKELEQVAEEFGDPRRTTIAVEATPAAPFMESDLVSNESVTVVLSQKGWVRSAKGHDIDPESLNYREGDSYLASVKARTNDSCTFFDSTGRSYSLLVRSLPSARSFGEPLTSSLSTPDGARFLGLASGVGTEVLIANDKGEGFVLEVSSSHVRPKAGRVVVSKEPDRKLLPTSVVANDGRMLLITKSGFLLVLRNDDVPKRRRSKGVRLINVRASGRSGEEDELVKTLCVGPTDTVQIRAGKRILNMKPQRIDEYLGNRGNRGRKLPRGYTKVDDIRVVT